MSSADVYTRSFSAFALANILYLVIYIPARVNIHSINLSHINQLLPFQHKLEINFYLIPKLDIVPLLCNQLKLTMCF